MIGLLFVLAQEAFQERLAATAPEGAATAHFAFSADGRTAAIVVKHGPGKRVVAGGKEGPAVQDAFLPQLSADGTLLCYGVQDRGQKYMMIRDRQEGPYKALVPGAISPRGDRVAFGAVEEERTCMHVGGVRGEAFDQVGPPVWSPDGARVAYMAERKKRQFVVLGDEKGEEFETVLGIVFSRDGKTLAYTAQKDGRFFLVVGGKAQEMSEPVTQVVLRGEGKTPAYAAMVRDEGRVYVYTDGKAFAPYPYARHLVSSEDGNVIAYVGKGGGQEFLVFNGRKEAAVDEVWGPVLSPDGKKAAYWAVSDDKLHVVCGAKKSDPFELSENQPGVERLPGRGPAFSPDGKKVGFGVRKGREFWWKVLDLD